MAAIIDSNLKRQAVLSEIVRALKPRLSMIRAFAYKVSETPVRLEGTNVVAVPYIPLESAASTDWNAANGYVAGDGTVSAKPITVNKRKYQSLGYSSQDVRDQPGLLTDEIMAQKVFKLVADVSDDIASSITSANFGAAAYTGSAASMAMSVVATLQQAAIEAEFPEGSRSLVLNPAYHAKLITDSGVIGSMNYGSPDAVRTGTVPDLLGFRYYGGAKVPANAQNLVGFIAVPSAIGIAMAPVAPAAGVRDQLTAYEQYMDEDQTFILTYREWGNPALDTVQSIIECAYGFGVIESAGLKRIVSA
jgi:hypothetical protein